MQVIILITDIRMSNYEEDTAQLRISSQITCEFTKLKKNLEKDVNQ